LENSSLVATPEDALTGHLNEYNPVETARKRKKQLPSSRYIESEMSDPKQSTDAIL
jgi:hypothetical protein